MKTLGGILLGIFTLIYWNLYYINLYKYWQSVKENPDDALEKKAILIKNILLQIIMAGLGLYLIVTTLQLLGMMTS